MATPAAAQHFDPSPSGAPVRSGSVFTVPVGTPFLDALAKAILAGDLCADASGPPDALTLPETTVLLPTRRAARALQDAFLRVAPGRALLLPRIRPIAEGDEDLSLLAASAGIVFSPEVAAEIPPAVGELERRLLLTELVMRWSDAMRGRHASADGAIAPVVSAGAGTAAQAAQLAAELARLLDLFATEGASLDSLRTIVADRYASHWQTTLQFLEIVLAWWPAELAQMGRIAPADRRSLVLRAEAARLRAAPPATPIIVAGVTGSIPATVDLMQAVLSLPQGAVVLPGLDQSLDDYGWDAIWPADPKVRHPEHPQAGLARLLHSLGVTRDVVRVLPGADISAAQSARNRLVSEALRPAATTERWHEFIATTDRDEIGAAMQDVSLVECPTAEDEAEVVALILRQAVETPGRTAALVSRDRLLARRVAIRLQAWGIRVDDSAGRPFRKTMPGAFLDLLLEAVASEFAPAATMALLKHPLTRLGLDAFEVRRAARALEVGAFRRIYLGRGLHGIEAALEHTISELAAGARVSRATRRVWPQDWHAARELVQRMRDALGDLEALFAAPGKHALADLARAHMQAAEAAATPKESRDGNPIWDEEAGEVAATLFAELTDAALRAPHIAADEYPDFYRGLVGMEAVRPRIPVHPRIFIWGPFESRLQQPDVVVIGGLNEGTWPEALDPGPWLSRPMLAELGLPVPEERLGYAAHDFAQALGAAQVFLTRAEKSDGVPRVASRWLLRLKGLLDGLDLRHVLEPREPWLAWAMARTVPGKKPPARAPAPRPALSLRPRRLSVSDVETWIANPYAVFASRILGLEELPALGERPDAALRGAMVHGALSRFAAEHAVAMPDEPLAALDRYAQELLGAWAHDPRIAAFWLPRFRRFAEWFAASEPARRAGLLRQLAEVDGKLVLDAPEGPFTLTARADRIDVTDAGAIITDYKTMTASGLATLARKAKSLAAPQLVLEALIASKGGFAQVPQAAAGLRYISASGAEPPGCEEVLEATQLPDMLRDIETYLTALVARYDDPATPYTALRRPQFDYTFDAFAHLARVDEWSTTEPVEG